MGTLLSLLKTVRPPSGTTKGRRAALVLAAFAAPASTFGHYQVALAQSDRHEFYFDASAGYVSASTGLGTWTDGAVGKLRHADDGVTGFRLVGEYRGRLSPTLRTRIVADYVDDASSGLDLTEAILEWRPVPRSRNQHSWRFGAFYPAFSLENGDRGWQSPFTYSYSAINTWLGEEIRPVGAEWSMRRRLEGVHSAHELRAFAAGFYGNDPAATLLFWRGWSLHDRQSRLNDELAIPPLPFTTGPQRLTPFMETDHEPGAYAGLEWRYARRALVQFARYDNRADPWSFSDGHWGWATDFNHLAVQVSLPADLGLIFQWMDGTTEWLSGALPNGTRLPTSERVQDRFDSQFIMLTRTLGSKQRLAVRYDTFETQRPRAVPVLHSDEGHAWTLSYRIEATDRFSGGIEWLRIDSERDLWPLFYGTAREQSEDQLRLQLSYRLAAPAR
jgi:hypothetical protein